MNSARSVLYHIRNHLLVVLCVLPLLFIGNTSMHDWGDDFAQYLWQTKQFLEHKAIDSSPIINSESYSPYQRGAGFSLILSPVYYFFGASINSNLSYLSLFLVLLAVVLLGYYKMELGTAKSMYLYLLIILAFAYNHHVISGMHEIVPLFVFSFVLYLSLVVENGRCGNCFVFFSIVLGVLISIKVIGLSLYLASVLYYGLLFIKHLKKTALYRFIMVLLIPLVVASLIKWLVFNNITLNEFLWYEAVFCFKQLFSTVFENALYYAKAFTWLFEKEIWNWFNILMKICVSILFLVGAYSRYIKKISLTDWFLVFYVGVLLTYKYSNAGIRFLLPILPIILLYVAEGALFLSSKIRVKALVPVFFIVMLVSNFVNIKMLAGHHQKQDGPQIECAVDCFDAINKMIPEASVIAFAKPWIIPCYTNSLAYYVAVEDENIESDEVDFVLVSVNPSQSSIYNSKLNNYLNNSAKYTLLWYNTCFALYKHKKIN